MFTLLDIAPIPPKGSFFEGILQNLPIILGAVVVAAAIIVAAVLIARAIKKNRNK